MPRLILLVVLLPLLFTGCPAVNMTSYDKARSVLAYSPTALLVADAIVARWTKHQTDKEKIDKTVAQYQRIKKAVAEGIAAALKSVDVAEEAGKPVDERKLNDKIRVLIKKALDFTMALEDAVVPTPASAPTSTPTTPNA